MSFSGIDVGKLRALARHIDWDVVPRLRRDATVALVTLDGQDMHGLADRSSFAMTSVAAWLDRAATDLMRRAAIVEGAERLGHLASPMPASVTRHIIARAEAVVSGSYTADTTIDIQTWIAETADHQAAGLLEQLGPALADGDLVDLADVAGRIDAAADEPWFPAAMAALFDDLGPRGAAVLVHRLVAVPAQYYDDTARMRFAAGFAAATRGGLAWTEEDVTEWFEHGPVGAAQLLRGDGVDAGFVQLVIDTVGLGDYEYRGEEPVLGIRVMLGAGAEMAAYVGPRAGDHRAVILDALVEHLSLAVDTLQAPGVVESLVADPWKLDKGAALGSLLSAISAHGERTSASAVDDIRQRALRTAAGAEGDVARELRPALADLTAHHLGDLALSLAIGDEISRTGLRSGLELPATDVRRLLRLIAEHDEAFSRLSIYHGSWVAREISGDPDDLQRRLGASADEIGALTFALAYTDRTVRIEQSAEETSRRLSTLHVLEFLASTGVALLPGPIETATAFGVERTLRTVKHHIEKERPDAVLSHNAWKEQMLADIEYLIALEMNDAGLLDRRIDRTSLSRLEFLYLVEEIDGPLEQIMAIIETQARRQREAVEETG